MAAHTEEGIARQITAWLRDVHPELSGLYHWDYGSGLYMTKSQAVRQKLLNDRGWPDFALAVPALYYSSEGSVQTYHGLFLELKRDEARLRKKDGSWASDHIAEQAEIHQRLADQGYIAIFVCGFDQAVKAIESYLSPTTDTFHGTNWGSVPVYKELF